MGKAAGCFVVNRDKVLAFMRFDENSSGVALPCGKVESGESFAEAAVREVFEETGYRVYIHNDIDYYYEFEEQDGFEVVIFSAIVDNDTPRVIPSHAHEGEVMWLDNEEPLVSGPYGSFNRRMIEHFRKHIPNLRF